MNPAIIRLAKRYEVNENASQSALKRLWDSINSNIQDLNSRRAGPGLSWEGIHRQHQENLTNEATEYGEGVRSLSLNRLPDDGNLTDAEKYLVVERSRTVIADFTEQPNSLVLHYYLVTEQIILLETIGSRLLLATSNAVEALQKGTVVENTFTIDLDKSYDIVEYMPLKLKL